jgi:energy-coupling factor transporter ATP-binding protein EcfA2
MPRMLDVGYVEFLIDMITGSLGIYTGQDGQKQIWRRHNAVIDRIQAVEVFYGVAKPVHGFMDVMLDIFETFPDLAPKKVTAGIALENMLLSKFDVTPLDKNTIPRIMIPVNPSYAEVAKAGRFFDLICPDPACKHNLLMATVYPYYNVNNEKFFLLHGIGGNGKSTYLRHFATLLGERYGGINLKLMATGNFDANSANSLLMGKLVVNNPETDFENPKFLEPLKKVATGEMFIARSIGKNAIWFKSEPTLFCDTNTNVNLENISSIDRRLVGIRFVDRELTHEDMEPYFDWVNTKEGAAAIFRYAYNYFVEIGGSRFTWKDVDIRKREQTGLEQRSTDMLYAEWVDSGDTMQVLSTVLPCMEMNTRDRGKFYSDLGLNSAVKRGANGGRAKRFVIIENPKKFHAAMEGYGYDMQRT